MAWAPSGGAGGSGGGSAVSIAGPLTDFSRLPVAEPTPLSQIDFSHGVPTGAFVSYNSAGTGALTGQKGSASLSTGGTAAGAYVTLFSTRGVRFRDGIGIEASVVVKYATPQEGTIQLAGVYTAEDGYAVGYAYNDAGDSFSTEPCVHVKSNGVRQIEILTLSGSTAGGTVDVSVGAVSDTIVLSAGSLRLNALEISQGSYPGWRAYPLEEYVVFIRESVGAASAGTYSATAGTPATGSFATATTGDNGTDTWVTQSNWSIDSLDGSGPSGETLNMQEWNTFKFVYSDTSCAWYWQAEGGFVLFHRARATSDLLVSNSNLLLQATCYNAASVVSDVTMQVAGMSGLLSGPLRRIGARRADPTEKLGLTTTLTPISSYRLAPVFQGINTANPYVFTGEVYFPFVSIANDGNRAAVVDLIVNADLTAPQWESIAGLNVGSGVDHDQSATATSGGVTIASFPVSKGQTTVVDVSFLDLVLVKNQTFTFAARTIASTTDIVITPSWVEER